MSHEPAFATGQSASNSYYKLPIRDAGAIYLGDEKHPCAGDGVADDTRAVQKAIDAVARRWRWRGGIVFVPAGTYRLSRTIHIWRGVRLIGFGPTRPTFLLGARTPGFQEGEGRCLIQFCNSRPFFGGSPPDASNITFYSGLNNIDVQIDDGNPAAVVVRYNVAQHSSIEHAEFRIGSALGGVDQAGNEIEDCRFLGGRFGIRTGRTSAGWQTLVLDCEFAGQRDAAIETREAGMTCIRDVFRDAPRGVKVPGDAFEELYLQDCRFHRVATPVTLGDTADSRHQFNAVNIACEGTDIFADIPREGRKLSGPSRTFVVDSACVGLHVSENVRGEVESNMETAFHARAVDAIPPIAEKDFPSLPPQAEWVDVRDYGAKGDGVADDTAALRRAIASARAVYLPMGRYRLSDTLELRADTVLIGLHPRRTQFVLRSHTDGFGDEANPRPMIRTARGGGCVMTGLGTNPTFNSGAIAVHWLAGEKSFMDDVYFGRTNLWGSYTRGKGRGVHLSLLVSDGGGGTFKNIWSECYFAKTGMTVRDTQTPGRTYLLSIEHHLELEVELSNVANWTFRALQTEENLGSERATAVAMRGCRNLLFTNLFCYRVMATRMHHPQAVIVSQCRDISVRGMHIFSLGPYPYDNSIHLQDCGKMIPQREVASWKIPENT